MNERIIKLYEQAQDEVVDSDCADYYERIQLKFAELIIKECANVVANVPPAHGDYRDQIECGMRDFCVQKVLKHFGVQE